MIFDATMTKVQVMMRTLNLDPQRHQLWAGNISHNLDGMSAELVDQVVRRTQEIASPGFDTEDVSVWGHSDFEYRPLTKTLRDLHQPYTDQQVSERLEQVSTEALALVERMKETPRRMFVIGSINKGYFGGLSDIDLLCVSDRPFQIEGAYVAGHRSDDMVNLLRTDDARLPMALEFAGPHVEVTPGNFHDSLRNTWKSSLYKINMALEESPDGQVQVHRTGPFVIAPESPWDIRRDSGLLSSGRETFHIRT